MSDTAERLVRLLADGALHSGERLADDLGVTRAAVWKSVAELRERGIDVASHDRRGYQLPRPVELLDVAALRAAATGCRACRCPRTALSSSKFPRPTNTCRPPTHRPWLRRDSSSRSCRRPAAAGAAASGSRRSVRDSRSRSAGRSPRCRPISRRSAWRWACASYARCARWVRPTRSSSGPTTSCTGTTSSAACCCRCAPRRAGRRTSSPGSGSTSNCRPRCGTPCAHRRSQRRRRTSPRRAVAWRPARIAVAARVAGTMLDGLATFASDGLRAVRRRLVRVRFAARRHRHGAAPRRPARRHCARGRRGRCAAGRGGRPAGESACG